MLTVFLGFHELQSRWSLLGNQKYQSFETKELEVDLQVFSEWLA